MDRARTCIRKEVVVGVTLCGSVVGVTPHVYVAPSGWLPRKLGKHGRAHKFRWKWREVGMKM